MTRLGSIIFATVTLWILCRTQGIGLLSPYDDIQHAFLRPGSAIRTDSLKGEQTKDSRILSGILGTDSLKPTEEASLSQNQESDSSLIERFVAEFTKAILSSPEMSKVYTTSLSPDQAVAVYERIVFVAIDNIYTDNPTDVTKTVTSAIRATWANLTLTQHIQTYAYAAANYMIYKNALTCGNLSRLCNQFLYHVKQRVCNLPKIPDPRNCYIQAADDALVHFLISLNIFTADGMNHLAHDYADATHCLTGIPPPLPEDPCCKKNLLKKFVTKFTKTIVKSGTLSQIFVPYLPPEEAAEVYSRIVYNQASNIYAPGPKTVVRTITDAIQLTYGKLTVSQHIIACAYSVAAFMKYKKVLTCENLDEICDSYVSYINQAVSNVPNISDRKYALIRALLDSLFNFLISVDLFRADTILTFAQILAKALCSVTGVSPDVPWPENIDETVLDDDSWATAII